MLTFSLDPEITSFLWIKPSPQLPNDVDLALYHRIGSPSRLYQILVPSSAYSDNGATIWSTIQCTVVTTGILVAVGIGSTVTYKLLQYVRENVDESISFKENIKNLLTSIARPFILLWRMAPVPGKRLLETPMPSPRMETSMRNGDDKQIFKRPSDLQLVGSPLTVNRLLRPSRENSLERRLLTKARTPLADCDIASGEEDISDIQGQYFGPTTKSSTICMELMGSSPEESPIHSSTKWMCKPSPKKESRNHGGKESSC